MLAKSMYMYCTCICTVHVLIHTYIKRRQAARMADLISKCDKENGVLQVDFSENATIMTQNETQSAHWHHG